MIIKSKYFRVILSFLNSVLASLLFFNEINFAYVKVISIISFLFFIALCYLERGNILFFARTVILGLIGYFPIFFKCLFGQDALFSPYEPSTQTLRVVVLMYIFTSYSLFGNAIGLTLGQSNFHTADKNSKYPKWTIAFYISIPIVIVAAYLYTLHFGDTIFVASYASSEKMQPSLIGSLNSFGISSLYIIFLAGLKYNYKYWKFIFIFSFCYFVIYATILHGGRQDAITPILGLFILYNLNKGQILRINLVMLPLIFVLLIFFEAWGTLRGSIGDFSLDLFVNLIPEMFSGDAARFGTVSPLATTFSNCVWLIDSGTLDLFYGKTYFEYILRTPPEFIFPSRPVDYSLLFEKYDLQTVGGFYELGEAYINFGFIGALLVPGTISFLLSKSYYYVLKTQSLIAYFFLFSFLCCFLRGTCYQTFAFYKAFLVCMVLYLFIMLVESLLNFKATCQK